MSNCNMSETIKEDGEGCEPRRVSVSSTGSRISKMSKRSSLRNIAGNLMNMRRVSKAFGLLGGPARAEQQKPLVKLENTYKMEPDEGTRFNTAKATAIIKDVLSKYIGKNTYDKHKTNRMVMEMSSIIKSRVKELHAPRYKLVCNVHIIENRGQGVHDTSQCIWDTSSDRFATATLKTDTMLAVATVHALYFE